MSEGRKRLYDKLTERDMDNIVKLVKSGWKQIEVVELTGISKSAVSRVCCVYNAAVADDWPYLLKATKTNSNTVDWALKRLNKTLPNLSVEAICMPVQDCTISSDDVEVVSLNEIKESLDNIAKILCNLLDMLK